MRSGREDPRFAKVAVILKRRDRAAIALLIVVLGMLAGSLWKLDFLLYHVGLAVLGFWYYLLATAFSRCPFCGDRWGIYASLREALNPSFVYKRPGFLMSRCINCGASDEPASS